jgi:hypothetical protein
LAQHSQRGGEESDIVDKMTTLIMNRCKSPVSLPRSYLTAVQDNLRKFYDELDQYEREGHVVAYEYTMDQLDKPTLYETLC